MGIQSYWAGKSVSGKIYVVGTMIAHDSTCGKKIGGWVLVPSVIAAQTTNIICFVPPTYLSNINY